jgi:hypothetical protein
LFNNSLPSQNILNHQKGNFKSVIMLKKTLLLFILSFAAFAQNTEDDQTKSVEQLLEKKNPNQYKTLVNKRNYLVINHINSGKRIRIYEGDIFRFQTHDGILMQEPVQEITDSTFTVVWYDEGARHLQTLIFKPEEIAKYYKREVKKGINSGISWGSLGALSPLLYDWMIFRIPPHQNINSLWGVLGIQAGITLMSNRNKFFNAKKFTNNRQLRIFKTI